MSIINDSHAIGVDSRNLVLKTRGTLHVKVGDRYYEIDFRNLAGSNEDKDKTKEDYIIPINSKDDIGKLEYPGDNKLIVGLDGTLFVTMNNTIKEITSCDLNAAIESATVIPKIDIFDIKSAFVSNKLHGDGGSFDFANGEIITKTLIVEDSIKIPASTIKNKCCRTQTEILDDGTERVIRKYQDYDFIELVKIPDFLSVKSGVIIKSTIDAKIPIFISDVGIEFSFETNGLYIVYKQNTEIIITKLN